MNCFGFIFARGGSKGIPRKNVRPLCGRPLIAWSVGAALACRCLDRIYVSTEDDEIAAIARSFGAEIPFQRPAELAADNSAEILSWRHAIKTMSECEKMDIERDIFISVPCTSPFRSPGDIDACVDKLKSTGADICVTVTETSRHPAFNMLRQGEDGYFKLIMQSGGSIIRRQDAPVVYDMTTVCYAARAGYVLDTASLLAGKVCAVVIPPERAIDIDTELDFRFAQFLGQEKEGQRL